MGFPDFGKEMHRPFNVDERCYDCAEFYGPGHGQPGCNAMPANPNARCLDYLRLPDVGVDGQTGQEIPPSRMGGRKEPRITLSAKTINDPPADPAANKAKARTIASINPQPERQPSPAGNPGPDGDRRCSCGAILRKRQRCCANCRAKRRKDSKLRYRNREQSAVASRSDPDMPFPASGRPPTLCWGGAHN